MKLALTARALADLEMIADYLIERSPQGARSVGNGFERTFDLISRYPNSGRTVKQRPNVRAIPVTRYPYIVFYMQRTDAVVILHVRHTSRSPVDPADL